MSVQPVHGATTKPREGSKAHITAPSYGTDHRGHNFSIPDGRNLRRILIDTLSLTNKSRRNFAILPARNTNRRFITQGVGTIDSVTFDISARTLFNIRSARPGPTLNVSHRTFRTAPLRDAVFFANGSNNRIRRSTAISRLTVSSIRH